MEGNEIDYSNTIIYKISCKDENVKDLYVGHTTNFVQRKQAHKYSCINKESAYNNSKVYNVIRANGGWNNWSMDIVNFYNCRNLSEAREKEQEYYISLKATLNSVEPFPNPIDKKERNNIKKVQKEKKIQEKDLVENITILTSKHACNYCTVVCSRASEYVRHLLTRKHIANENDMKMRVRTAIKQYKCCKCNKIYVTHGGLWKHMKKCGIVKEPISEKITDHISEKMTDDATEETVYNITKITSLVMELIKINSEVVKKNNELQKLL